MSIQLFDRRQLPADFEAGPLDQMENTAMKTIAYVVALVIPNAEPEHIDAAMTLMLLYFQSLLLRFS